MKPIAFKYSQNTPKRYDTADINFLYPLSAQAQQASKQASKTNISSA
tara:strand:- start:176 stop:316 length:141 start_codon:yes stop_codon:yes gene_type:complete